MFLGKRQSFLAIEGEQHIDAGAAEFVVEQIPNGLVIVGDEDESCIEGSLFLKRTVPTAGLLVVPRSGHNITSEEPAAFNAALADFFAAAEAGRWLAHRPPA